MLYTLKQLVRAVQQLLPAFLHASTVVRHPDMPALLDSRHIPAVVSADAWSWAAGEMLPLNTSSELCLQSAMACAADVNQVCGSDSLSGVFPCSVPLALDALELPLLRAQLQHSGTRSAAQVPDCRSQRAASP